MDNGEVKNPETISPQRLWTLNPLLFIVALVFCYTLFGLWGIAVSFLILAYAISAGFFTEEIEDFHAGLLYDPIFKTRRALFAGFHLKLPWEYLEDGSVRSLKHVITSSGKDAMSTNDPAESMLVGLTILMRANTTGTPEEAAEKFIRFSSIDEKSLEDLTRKELLQMLEEYYSGKEMEALLNAKRIEKAVFVNRRRNVTRVEELECYWGMSLDIVVDNSSPDDPTKDMKRTPAKAEALKLAIQELVAGGMTPEEARRAALLLDKDAEFSEQRIDLEVKVEAPDLKNVRDINIIPPGSLGGKKPKKS